MAFRDTPAMRLRGAYLTMHRQFQRLFRRQGTTADQFVLLTILLEEDGLTQKELVRRSFSDANTIAAMLKRMERDGLIGRTRHELDARATCVRLTDEGRAVQRRLVEASRRLHQRVEESLPAQDRAVILNWLQSLAGVMNEAGKPAKI